MYHNLFLISSFLLILTTSIDAQFDPPAGQTGSLAIASNDGRLVAWATTCTVQRGWQNIAQPSLGTTASGTEIDATGAAGDGRVLSLGDGGMATLEFANPIVNGQGVDFVVFENGFSDTFLELAFVEVSSDGVHFVRFPAISNLDTTTQIATFGSVDATKIHNLAGKYRAGYGVGFDLDELKNEAFLDVNHIQYVRIIDVVGSISESYVRRDSRGLKINDPYPTPFDTGGFDLDAIGVVYDQTHTAILETKPNAQIELFYQNPTNIGSPLQIQCSNVQQGFLQLCNPLGQIIQTFQITENMKFISLNTNDLQQGMYHIQFISESKQLLFSKTIIFY